MPKLNRMLCTLAALSLVSTVTPAQTPSTPQQPPAPMTFFITSVGKGDGANVGGLAGADAHCKALADAANVQLPAGRTWRAYLSAVGAEGLYTQTAIPKNRPKVTKPFMSGFNHPGSRRAEPSLHFLI